MDQAEIAIATQLLQQGKVIAFPTDTLYGLGGDPHSTAVISKIFTLKGRSYNQALPVLIPKVNDLFLWADQAKLNSFGIRSKLIKLVEKFWPGPLTIVVPKSKDVSNLLTAHQNTIALRVPNHAITLELLQSFNSGIIGTSANKSGERVLSNPTEIKKVLGQDLFVLTGGQPPKGISSTIVAISAEIKILREGVISSEELKPYL